MQGRGRVTREELLQVLEGDGEGAGASGLGWPFSEPPFGALILCRQGCCRPHEAFVETRKECPLSGRLRKAPVPKPREMGPWST